MSPYSSVTKIPKRDDDDDNNDDQIEDYTHHSLNPKTLKPKVEEG